MLLVGHSYGGAVITEAGGDPKVGALAYIAAFAPDAGESAGSLLGFGTADTAGLATAPGRGRLPEDDAQRNVRSLRAGLVGDREAHALLDSGTDLRRQAWAERSRVQRGSPSRRGYLVAAQDRAIPPELERAMARKINAETRSVDSSHLAMLSQPGKVVELLLAAVR